MSATPLEGASAIVTGGSRGIGLACVAALRAEGANVLAVARGADALAQAEQEHGCTTLAADVSAESGVSALFTRARALWPEGPDILVISSGAFELAAVQETSIASFDRQIAANLRAPFLLMRVFLPAMLARGRGHIVTIGLVAGRRGYGGNGAYAASKFGVRGLHAVLAEELRGTGVRGTLIEPAATDTPIWDEIDRERHPGLPERESMLAAAEVAAAVVFAVTRPADVGVPNLFMERA